jgi:hypothetical protein
MNKRALPVSGQFSINFKSKIRYHNLSDLYFPIGSKYMITEPDRHFRIDNKPKVKLLLTTLEDFLRDWYKYRL